MKPILIVSTYPDKRTLNKIANRLVRSKIAACVNISKVSSVYMWKGKIEDSSEYVALFKTTLKNKKILKKEIAATHPYEVPEIVEIDVTSVNEQYYKWLVESTS